jgi:hypothetical protein
MDWDEEFVDTMPNYQNSITIEDGVKVGTKGAKWQKLYSGQLVRIDFENSFDKHKFLKTMNNQALILPIYYSLEDTGGDYTDGFIFVRFV